MKLGDLLLLPRLKERLVAGPLPAGQAFLYFAFVTAFDALQLAVLSSTSHDPGAWGAAAAWCSFGLGAVFVVLTFFVNGGPSGLDYLARYFSLCAVIGLYTAGPLQILLRLPHWLPSFAPPPWYAPALVVATNALMFGLILVNVADVARRTRGSAPVRVD
jgi:hypothetical protein